jgi:hypothetical protein
MSYIARDGNARLEELAFISLVFAGDPRGDGLQALKARGWLEVRTLLAAMQRGSTLGALLEVERFGQQGGAAVASGRRH